MASVRMTVGTTSILQHVLEERDPRRLPVVTGWVDHELNGYPEDAPLPAYRGPIETGVRAQTSGDFGPMVSNLPIPPGAFPEDLVEQSWLFRTEFRQPIEGLESFVGAEVQPTLAWSPDSIRVINAMIRRGEIRLHEMPMYFINADQHVSAQTFVEIVSAVRNRVLDLPLEFERLDPETGQPGAPPPDPAAATIVMNIIGSTVTSLAVASPDSHQHVAVARGDLVALLDRLRKLGVTDDDLDDLADAVDHEGPKPGSRVNAWLGRALGSFFDRRTTFAGDSIQSVPAVLHTGRMNEPLALWRQGDRWANLLVIIRRQITLVPVSGSTRLLDMEAGWTRRIPRSADQGSSRNPSRSSST